MYCKVKNCKFNSSHVTANHYCSNCSIPGHGPFECGNDDLIISLSEYNNDIVSDPCLVDNCNNPNTHTNEGHLCIFCGNYNTHMKLCPIIESNLKCDPKYDNKNYDFLKRGEYCDNYEGYDCYTYIRRNIENNNLEFLYMQKNFLEDIPRYRAFIYNYNKHNNFRFH